MPRDTFTCCGSVSLWYYCESLFLSLSLSHPTPRNPRYTLAYPKPHHANRLNSNPKKNSITFLGSLIYASVIYHRHRRAKSRFLRSLQDKELYPVIADELAIPAPRAPKTVSSCAKEAPPLSPGAEADDDDDETKEAVEVTVLKELGGDWAVYELPATAKSVRNSRGAAGGVR